MKIRSFLSVFLCVSVYLSTYFSMMILGSPLNAQEDLVFLKCSKITHAAIQGQAFENLKELVAIGPRISGSQGAAKAVEWARVKMQSYGFDQVILQPVKVPHWERGENESATMVSGGKSIDLKLAALGGSVGTQGIELVANVIEVASLADAEKQGSRLSGNIVFFNQKMNPNSPDPFQEYSNTVSVRYRAAQTASKYGAIATVIRSLATLPDDDHPHTGIMRYADGIKKIPAAALSTHAANLLSDTLKKDAELKMKISLSARSLVDADSYNVIGQYNGSDFPDQYVVTGGHLDSWDLSQSAHDDGAGVVQAIESVRTLIELKIRPKRSIRVVLFMSEEFGGSGAAEYANQAQSANLYHVGAIESDSGGAFPRGISVSAKDQVFDRVSRWLPYLKPTGIQWIKKGGSGADVGFLEEVLGTPTFGYVPDPTHYFDFHHSALDTIDNVNSSDLNHGAAAMSVFTYLMAELGT